MIQFNLLPDVKLKFIKAQRNKRLAITISFFCAAGALAILIIMATLVYGVQKKSLSDLNRDTTKYSSTITGTPQLNKILTVQNQLKALPNLESKLPHTSQLFTYLAQTTPNQASISQISIDFSQNTWTISGDADSINTIDQFVDTYKFTTYSTGSNGTSKNSAFSNVVLNSFGQENNSARTSYNITASFSPIIFNPTQSITLNVPAQITTRSVTQLPQLLFNGTSPSTSK